MRIALEDLKLDRLVVVYPGERRYPLGDRVEVLPLVDLVGAGAEGGRQLTVFWMTPSWQSAHSAGLGQSVSAWSCTPA